MPLNKINPVTPIAQLRKTFPPASQRIDARRNTDNSQWPLRHLKNISLDERLLLQEGEYTQGDRKSEASAQHVREILSLESIKPASSISDTRVSASNVIFADMAAYISPG
jgi:hypothetical protein